MQFRIGGYGFECLVVVFVLSCFVNGHCFLYINHLIVLCDMCMVCACVWRW